MVPSLPKSFPTRPFTAGEEYLMVIVLPLTVIDSVWPLLVSAQTKLAAAAKTPAHIKIDFMIVVLLQDSAACAPPREPVVRSCRSSGPPRAIPCPPPVWRTAPDRAPGVRGVP